MKAGADEPWSVSVSVSGQRVKDADAPAAGTTRKVHGPANRETAVVVLAVTSWLSGFGVPAHLRAETRAALARMASDVGLDEEQREIERTHGPEVRS